MTTAARELGTHHFRHLDWTAMTNHVSVIRMQSATLRDLAAGRSDQFIRDANVELAIIERVIGRLVAIAQESNILDQTQADLDQLDQTKP